MNNKKIKIYSYAKGYQKENNFIELATYKYMSLYIPLFISSGILIGFMILFSPEVVLCNQSD